MEIEISAIGSAENGDPKRIFYTKLYVNRLDIDLDKALHGLVDVLIKRIEKVKKE